jgi:hypothetical protein
LLKNNAVEPIADAVRGSKTILLFQPNLTKKNSEMRAIALIVTGVTGPSRPFYSFDKIFFNFLIELHYVFHILRSI